MTRRLIRARNGLCDKAFLDRAITSLLWCILPSCISIVHESRRPRAARACSPEI